MPSNPLSKQTHLLALHGFTGRGEDFKEFSSLCGPGISWNAPDLPGHGSEPLLDCTPEAMVRLIHAQKLEKPRVLLGYSMGARAALLHAIPHPDYWDALILISGAAGIESEEERTKRRQQDRVLAERILKKGVPAFLRYWQQTPIIQSQQTIRPDWLERMQSNRRQHTAEGLAASLREFGQANYPNLWAKIGQLHCPILLMTGELDRKYCALAERMNTLLPQAEWTSIPGAGHMCHLENPERAATAIRRFVSTLVAEGV